MLFRRELRSYSGGHLKVRHYFAHAECSTRFRPRIYIAPGADPTTAELWRGTSEPPLSSWQPELAEALFVAGDDWLAIPGPSPVPVVNLIQHVRHADPGTSRWTALARPAVRICVSEEVADAIVATGRVNGPVYVIPAGLDPAELPLPASHREGTVVIAGLKHPEFARELRTRLMAAGHKVDCIVDCLPRVDFLVRLARSDVVVTLPNPREGFFLPALEAMALGAITVCPDCIGNRSFCRDGETAFRPEYEMDAVIAAVASARSIDPRRAEAMRVAAKVEVERHSIEAERAAFLGILDRL